MQRSIELNGAVELCKRPRLEARIAVEALVVYVQPQRIGLGVN